MKWNRGLYWIYTNIKYIKSYAESCHWFFASLVHNNYLVQMVVIVYVWLKIHMVIYLFLIYVTIIHCLIDNYLIDNYHNKVFIKNSEPVFTIKPCGHFWRNITTTKLSQTFGSPVKKDLGKDFWAFLQVFILNTFHHKFLLWKI